MPPDQDETYVVDPFGTAPGTDTKKKRAPHRDARFPFPISI
jgi:hypothetical protein